MKVMKLALLGTAALAAASVSARAENLDALKAQIEALNARVATLEATPAVPAGYSAVAFSQGQDIVIPGMVSEDKNFGKSAHLITIMPTADAPAASTVLSWEGYVRAAVVAGGQNSANSYTTDIRTKAGFQIKGVTDTAVGEVGARVKLQAAFNDGGYGANNGNGYVRTDGYWGWWKMTPNLTFGGGVDGTLAKNSYTYDAACFHCSYTDFFGGISSGNWSSSYNPNWGNDPAQLRLSYADGPLGFAVAVEDGENYNNNSSFGVSAKATYKGDTFGVDLSGAYWGNPYTGSNEQAAWVVDAGAGASLGSMASVGAAVGIGSGFGSADDYTKASGYLKLNASDAVHFDVGLAHVWNTSAGQSGYDYTEFDTGLYYDPVKQLSLGLEGMYQSGGYADGTYRAAFVTIFSF